jgi:diamine N-acetyltransferase
MIQLELVTECTFKKVVDMKLPPEQGCFVAPNVVSLAQAWLYYDNARPYAICNDDNVVGFIMLDWDEGERSVGIWRFMIAPEHQCKGYGRKALEAAIKLAREAGTIDLLRLSYVPNNKLARDLYYSLGFRENGDVEDGEIVMTLPLTDSPKVGMLTADDEDMEDFIELIKSEKEAGVFVPTEFENSSYIEKAIADGCVERFTVMGETIGLAINGVILIGNQYLSYLAQARIIHDWYKDELTDK